MKAAWRIDRKVTRLKAGRARWSLQKPGRTCGLNEEVAVRTHGELEVGLRKMAESRMTRSTPPHVCI